MKLRCFIAMASGQNDIGRLYTSQIAPALRHQQVTPVLIEKLEHNDDIDDRIISELRASDFAIVDLTYARPSVYFEAGFAQRAVPVIYTCVPIISDTELMDNRKTIVSTSISR